MKGNLVKKKPIRHKIKYTWLADVNASVQHIVFTEEIYESTINDNAEDFPKVAIDAYPPVVIGVKCISAFEYWGDHSLVPNIPKVIVCKPEAKYIQGMFLRQNVCIRVLVADSSRDSVVISDTFVKFQLRVC